MSKWKTVGAVILIGIVVCFVFPSTKHLIIGPVAAQELDISKLRLELSKLGAEANLTGAGLCDECASTDPEKSNQCLGHLARHLVLMNKGTYCSPTEITAQDAKNQMMDWCQKVGADYPFPSPPLWKTMYAALSEKFPCH